MNRQDTRDALIGLTRKQELDPRLRTGDSDWVADRMQDYFEHRAAGLSHDQALNAVMSLADSDLGGPQPTPLPVPAPTPAGQPLEDLTEVIPGVFTEKRQVMRGSQPVAEDQRWVWKGVQTPELYTQYLVGDLGSVDPVLLWCQSLGANTVVVPAPANPLDPAVQQFLEHCRVVGHVRVYWEGVAVVKQLTPPVLDSPIMPGLPVPVPVVTPPVIVDRDPLDSVSTVTTDMTAVPPVVTPDSPITAFCEAVLAVWNTGGATLDLGVLPTAKAPIPEPAQRIAEWWFRGLGAVDPTIRDWQQVSPTDLLYPIQDASPNPRDESRVSGQYSWVLQYLPDPERLLLAAPGWRIVSVAGPANCLLHLYHP